MAIARGLTRAMLCGLPPRIPPDCRVLVLGSMPGTASLAADRYYAHPRNRFWPLMARLCGFAPGLDYESRIAALHEAGIGLWDVIGQCERDGSLDTAIIAASEIANPLATLIGTLPQLRVIAFNGGKAAQAFARHVAPSLDAAVASRWRSLALPSTSPANASLDLEALFVRWRVLAEVLNRSDEGHATLRHG